MRTTKELFRYGWLTCLVVGMGLALWACGKEVPCTTDTECTGKTYCDKTAGKCQDGCKTDTDCASSERCVANKCQGGSTEGVTPDGTVPDGTVPDGSTPDGSTPDGGLPEGTEQTQPPEKTPEATSSDSIPGKSPNCDTEFRSCYTGAAGTQDKGACKAGKQRCIDGNWGPCVGEVTPQKEECNGIDDDCDGQIDTGSCATWAASFGGKEGDTGYGIAAAPDGSIYITGSFSSSVTFGSTTLNAQGENDAYVAKLDATGKTLWVSAIGGTGNDVGRAVATDASGNVYVLGFFEGSISLGAITLTSKGGKNLFVAKMDDTGKLLWASTAGGATGGVEPQSIAVDKDGNAYIAGSFEESATFGSTNLTSKGGIDIFVAKLDASGQFMWASSAGGPDSEEAFAITVDASGNSYITGYFQGTAVFGPVSAKSDDYTNAFFAKLDASGQFVWASNTTQSWYAAGKGIRVDASGNVYATGYFEGQAGFGLKGIRSDYGTDIFVTKLNPTGQYQWTTSVSGYANASGKGLEIDSAGNLYLTGSFVDVIKFGNATVTAVGNLDIFVAKISSSGTFTAAKSMGGPQVDAGECITLGKDGMPYIIGVFNSGLTHASTTLTSKGSTDVVVAKVTF
ncbi:MAG: SBBP repeat-containing protein [Myxococcales bacterium]|nr:SBBP repeat-containing protein [Myxococcales bacterium]